MKASPYFTEVPGIIGGLGPQATNYFISLLINIHQPAVKKDQDHIPFLTFNNPQIPDRTGHLVHGKEDPLPELVRTGILLKYIGATFLAIPCNTAHAYSSAIEKHVGIPVMNMVTLTVQHIIDTFGRNASVGLLATDGTIESKVYQNEFTTIAPTIRIITPTPNNQEAIHETIYQIKASGVDKKSIKTIHTAAMKLVSRGADAVILGCTEIPLAIQQRNCTFPIIDPMEVLAQQVVAKTWASKVIPKLQIIPRRLYP